MVKENEQVVSRFILSNVSCLFVVSFKAFPFNFSFASDKAMPVGDFFVNYCYKPLPQSGLK